MKRNASFNSHKSDSEDSDDALFGDELYGEIETLSADVEAQVNLIIDKIYGRKFMKNEDDGELCPWFLIKWRGKSNLHNSWERQEDLEKVDPNGKVKIKRFLQSSLPPNILGISSKNPSQVITSRDNDQGDGEDDDDEEEEIEYYHPDVVDVQRIIACDTPSVSHATAATPEDILAPRGRRRKSDDDYDEEDEVTYLVKWKGCPYDECSWERWGDIKFANREVWLFWRLQKPTNEYSSMNSSPPLQEYKKFSVSPVFGVPFEALVKAETSNSSGSETATGGEEKPSVSLGLRLRDYQMEGLNWLLWNWWHKRSCILADEMGLGKTIQSVSFLHQLRFMKTTSINGPFLVIAPLSLIDQWQSEISTWSPQMNCVLLHGNQEARETIVSREFYYQEPYVSKAEASMLKRNNVYKFNILLTTFENAVKEISTLTKIPWQVMIIDEAHKLKNAQSRIFSTLSTIKCQHCVLLTGTPLQNKTEELWALLNFAEPKRFNDVDDFLSKFGDLKNAKQVANLHDLLKPYLLRRIKEDVEKSLPPKEETIIEVALTTIQKRFYRAIYEKNTTFLFKGVKASNQPSLMNIMMELRKCCNHPYLVRGVEDRIHDELAPDETNDPHVTSKMLVDSCGKMVLLDKLLPRLFSQGHKVLIFSQMVRVLNLLEDFLKIRGYTFERLDGSTKSNERKEAVERFCKPSMNRFIMLLSTKAGGLGLNLTAADTVIIYDSDWNPQNDLQAQARAHRIGQTKPVMVYRLLTRKTYEMEMFHQASMKLGLDRAVLAHARNQGHDQDAHQSSADTLKLSTKEIDELLKKGAYDVFREDDTEQNEFVEADIDSIMQRRSHKLVYGDKSNTAAASLGTFSKASFVSADEKEDVDINDPDFWRKAIGLTDAPSGILHVDEVVEDLPSQRIRRQVKGYNDEPLYNEEVLNEYLKPISAVKMDKQARAEAAEKKRLQKEEQRETALKEKLERDEARRVKAQEEARMRADPRYWGSHGRDRLLRSLAAFGFGRWEKIKGDTGKAAMDNADLEAFCRHYILQCTISMLGDGESHRNDPPCVLEALETLKILQEEDAAGIRPLDIPEILKEERFMAKLRAGALGKKTLTKLDLLAKLSEMVLEAIHKVITEKQIVGFDVENEDIDRLFNSLPIGDLSLALPLGDVRPPWSRSCPWWDFDCDRHLVLGIFRHGIGRYDLIKKDTDLVFAQKIQSHLEAKGIFRTIEDGTQEGSASDPTSGQDGNDLDPASASANNPLHPSTSTSMMMLDGDEDDHSDNDQNANHNANDDDDLDGSGGGRGGAGGSGPGGRKSGGGGAGAQSGSVTFSGEDMPDPRHLNRLFHWLVTSETARLFEADIVPVAPPEKKERKPRSDSKKAQQKQQADAAGETANTTSTASTHANNGGSGNGAVNSGEEAPKVDLQQMESLSESELGYQESLLISTMRTLLDTDSILASLKAQISGLKKCETILASLMQPPPARPPQKRNRHKEPVSASTVRQEGDGATMEMDVEQDATAEPPQLPRVEGEEDDEVDDEDDEDDDEGESTDITENEAVTLSATFILYGAPTVSFLTPSTYAQVREWMGFASNQSLLGRRNKRKPQRSDQQKKEANKPPLKKRRRQDDNEDNKDEGIDEDAPDEDENAEDEAGSEDEDLDEGEEEGDGYDEGRLAHFNWDNILAYSKLTLSPSLVEKFYSHVWLPFCQQILRKKSLSSSQNKFVVPNPLIPLSEHHMGAKGLCQLFIVRQHCLRTVAFVLNCLATKLMEYLRSAAGRSVDHMPIWWCPWIHDLGLLVGMLKHGYMMLDRIFADPELPFYSKNVETFVRRVFIKGGVVMPPMARFDLSSAQEVDAFVHYAACQYPEAKDVELRVMKILEEVTKHLSADHHASLPITVQQYRALISGSTDGTSLATNGSYSNGLNELDKLSGGSTGANDAGGGGAHGNGHGGNSQGKKSDGRSNRSTARPPAVSLKTFIQSSRKRRKSYVMSYHPSAFESLTQFANSVVGSSATGPTPVSTTGTHTANVAADFI